MIYLEHPSFGIQLQHLTEGGKVQREGESHCSARHLSHDPKCRLDVERLKRPSLQLPDSCCICLFVCLQCWALKPGFYTCEQAVCH